MILKGPNVESIVVMMRRRRLDWVGLGICVTGRTEDPHGDGGETSEKEA